MAGPPRPVRLRTRRKMSLRPLLDIAHSDERFRRLAAAAREPAPAAAGASAAIRPYLVAALAEDPAGLAGRPLLVVAPDDIAARDLAREAGAFVAPRRVRLYPSRGTGYASHLAPPPHLVGLRIAALDALTGWRGEGEPPLVVASATALAEAIPDASLRPGGFALAVGDEVDLGEIAERLVDAGYERAEQVEERGQFALRGGILDVFGATEDRAARIELFGDEVESIRWFSTFTQRSLGEAERVEVAPAAELGLEHRELGELALEEGERPDVASVLPLESFGPFLDLVPAEAASVVHGEDARRLYVEVAGPLRERAALSLRGAGEDGLAFRAQAPTSAARSVAEAEPLLERELRDGYAVVVAFEHRGEAERARYALTRLDAALLDGAPAAPEPGRLLFAEAPIGEGFLAPELRLAVYPYRRLVHRRRAAAPAPARGRLASFADLRVGDYVVHEDHGIARFAG